MVISAENRPPSSPGPMAAAASPPSRQESPSRLLHDFSFPILKTWGRKKMFRCLNVNRKGEIIVGGGRSDRSGRVRAPAVEEDGREDDGGLEEVRAKLMVHLQEAADRMNLVPVPMPVSVPAPSPSPAALLPEPSCSVADSAEKPWNLRTRRGAAKAPIGIDRDLSPSLPEPPAAAERRTVRLRSEDAEKRERPKFSISLSREEIDEDIYAVTGCRARRRPRKRARNVQKQLDSLFPGSWLSEITVDSYKVPD